MALRLSAAAWAAIGAAAAGAALVGAGVALRKGSDDARLKKPIWLGDAKPGVYRPGLKLGPMSDADRLEALLTTWMALSDAIGQQYRPDGQNALAWDALSHSYSPLMNVRDYFVPSDGPRDVDPDYYAALSLTADDARAIWDARPQDVLAGAEKLFRSAVSTGQALERANGMPLRFDTGSDVDLGALAEGYATDAALSYLAASIPGAGTVLAVGSLLGGPDWNMGITSRQVVGGQQMAAVYTNARRVAFSRALDLIRHAGGG